MTPTAKRPSLGRGLSALLPDTTKTSPQKTTSKQPPSKHHPQSVLIEEIHTNAEQPRQHFDDDKTDELAASIRTYGIIQPLIVSPRSQGGYHLIAGERRWRAATAAGLKNVPVVIRELSETDRFEQALIENIQRENLNPIEEATSYHRLTSADFNYTPEQIAQRVGKDRTTVANMLRLLHLPVDVQHMLKEGLISTGHARALLSLDTAATMVETARNIVKKGLSVRATEALTKPKTPRKEPVKSVSLSSLEDKLTKTLGSTTTIKEQGSGGIITVHYKSLDDLDRLLEKLL